MSIELKVKSKHLSVEAQIIRFEENKLRKQIKWIKEQGFPNTIETHETHKMFMSLKKHRRFDVRNENRATFLARAYLAGADYQTVENKRKPEKEYNFKWFILPRVLKLVQKYGGINHQNVTIETIREWVDKA